jgi:DNA invertase Pin-like site-specific DNA recombinase
LRDKGDLPKLSLVGRRKRTARPKGKRIKANIVAAAVELAGGVSAVAKLCGISRQSVYLWIQEWRVERLIDAIKLSRASGIPIEKLAGEAFDQDEKNGSIQPGDQQTK